MLYLRLYSINSCTFSRLYHGKRIVDESPLASPSGGAVCRRRHALRATFRGAALIGVHCITYELPDLLVLEAHRAAAALRLGLL